MREGDRLVFLPMPGNKIVECKQLHNNLKVVS